MNQPPEEFIPVQEARLLSFVADCFEKSGIDADHAAVITRLLVNSALRGVRSHGTRQLRRYVKEVRNGLVNTTPVTACCVRPTTVSVWTAPATRRMRSVSLSPPRATTGMWAVPAFTLDVS